MRLTFWILPMIATALPLAQCPADDDDTTDLQWYYTCGDPVCSGYNPPEGIPMCEGQDEGDPCSVEGEMCDPKSECNALMVCALEDPKAQGCPISQRAYKADIEYLTDDGLARVHDELVGMKLTTYRYKDEAASTDRHLGFIIEDVGESPAVRPGRDRVDLYGYTSMAVAAVQVQARQIDALSQKLDKLERELTDARKAAPQCTETRK